MRFGPRRPSLRGRIAARTSWKRYVRHSLGLKAPRGWGWLTNPRKAAYNRIYYRTTFDLFRLRGSKPRRKGSSTRVSPVEVLVVGIFLVALIGWLLR
jgi:hypothetical protein